MPGTERENSMEAAFTPEEHLAEVLGRYDESPDPRLAQIIRSLVTHLQGFVNDVQLTREEWFAGIEAITEMGKISTPERQEVILFSDTLGISMLVEMINHRAAPGTTEPTVFGPFHVEGAPPREHAGSMVIDDIPGSRPLRLSGSVLSTDGTAIAGATLDAWQTAPNGLYDVQDDAQSEMNLRGVFTTDADGRYEIHTIVPTAYPIPGDGPAGRLLFDNGRHNWRPGHIHFVVAAPGHKEVITHVFDADSDYLDSDAVFGVRESLTLDMSSGAAEFDFVLEPSPGSLAGEAIGIP
jgi:catechol 1,2-dioxygenase